MAKTGHKGSAKPTQPIQLSNPDASHGCALVCSEAGVLHVLESLTALNTTEATERGAPFSVFSALSGISGAFIHASRAPSLAFCLSEKI